MRNDTPTRYSAPRQRQRTAEEMELQLVALNRANAVKPSFPLQQKIKNLEVTIRIQRQVENLLR